MRRLFFVAVLITLVAACSSEVGEPIEPGLAGAGGLAGGGQSDAGLGGESGWAAGGEAGQAGAAGAAGAEADAGTVPEPCDCFLGDGAYCGGRAKALAQDQGCSLDVLSGHANDLLACEGGKWKVLEDCTSNKCDYDPSATKLDDACVLPVCDCFVQVAWCGAGVAKEANKMNCRVPLLPAHENDILYCPGGKWTVKQSCNLGCVQAPTGTPDYCKSSSSYKAPWACGASHTCTNGNHTSSHSGKDEYAYDFGMSVGTAVRAMRGGKVLRVRFVSKPGSACYNGGGSACANLANTVEILHSDGTVGLYMHLSKPTATVGSQVSQGQLIGYSGNSGYSTGPHLHVQVQSNCGIWWCQSKPFKFVEDSTVSAGTVVKSGNCG